jgi:hypothetical protein
MFDKLSMERWTEETMNMARTSIQTTTRNLGIVHEEAMKSIDFAVETTGRIQEQVRNAYDDWQKSVDLARRSCIDAVENGWHVVSSALNSSGPPKSKTNKEPK